MKFIRRGGAHHARATTFAPWRACRPTGRRSQTFLARFDLLLTPTAPVPPFAAGERRRARSPGSAISVLGWMPFTYPFNLTGPARRAAFPPG